MRRRMRGKPQEAKVAVEQRKSQDIKGQPAVGQLETNRSATVNRTSWWDPITLFTGVLVLVGIAQVWSFVASERAFLSVSALQFAGGLAAEKKVSIKFAIKNSGRTTAFVEDFNVTLKIVTPGLSKVPLKPEYKEGAEMAPGGIVPGGAHCHSESPRLRRATRT
jgi:hypothetical protein